MALRLRSSIIIFVLEYVLFVSILLPLAPVQPNFPQLRPHMPLIPGRDRCSCFPQHVLLTAPQVAPRTEASVRLMLTNICSVKE